MPVFQEHQYHEASKKEGNTGNAPLLRDRNTTCAEESECQHTREKIRTVLEEERCNPHVYFYGRGFLRVLEQTSLERDSLREQPSRRTRTVTNRTVVNSTCWTHFLDHYSKCRVNISPYAIRRAPLTNLLTEDVPEKVVSDRTNVGQDVLDKHYHKRSEEVKVEQRRDYLDGLSRGYQSRLCTGHVGVYEQPRVRKC